MKTFKLLVLVAVLAFVALTPMTVSGDRVRDSAPHEHHAGPGATGPTIVSFGSGFWSNPQTWGGIRVPRAWDDVQIAPGSRVVYDVQSSESIGSLVVAGALAFSTDVSTSLDVGDLIVKQGGSLHIGTPENPIPGNITSRLRFVNSQDGEHALMVFGEAQVHGAPLRYTYTRLSQPAVRGQRSIEVEQPVDWKRGDHIVIASTTRHAAQAEEHYIAAVEGQTLRLQAPLRFFHDGVSPVQAEVANLTRNVVITSKDPKLRGHTKYHADSRGSISYAEFSHLGGENQLGKYPIHFHEVGDSMKGSYVKGASIWNSGNRFITLHSAQYVTLSDNVGYNAIGHGYFMEDGDEMFNTLERNLGILVNRGQLIPSDVYAAVFWTQNPQNTYLNNIAAGSRTGRGFDFAILHTRIDLPGLGSKVDVRTLPLLRFENNEAHSSAKEGVRVYGLNGPKGKAPSQLVRVKSWRNGEVGAFLKGNQMVLSEAFLFGNGRVNALVDGNSNLVERGRLLGELPGAVTNNTTGLRAAPKGLVLGGKANVVRETHFEGHEETTEGLTGSDIALLQDLMQPIQASIEESVMRSSRPIVFGYPQHGGSTVEVRAFQGRTGDNFRLVRIDALTPQGCNASLDISLVAKRCTVPVP